MNDLGRYILSVGMAALIVGILTGFADSKSSIGILTRMIGGLVLALTVISPFHNVGIPRLEEIGLQFENEASHAVTEGESIANDALRELIKERTEAYILDKAGQLQLELEVDVTVADGETPVPESVLITGNASPYARSQLSQMLVKELGIPKEQQKWIG